MAGSRPAIFFGEEPLLSVTHALSSEWWMEVDLRVYGVGKSAATMTTRPCAILLVTLVRNSRLP